jgi:hypothetical protein
MEWHPTLILIAAELVCIWNYTRICWQQDSETKFSNRIEAVLIHLIARPDVVVPDRGFGV